MKILFIAPHPEEGASTRYRVKQFFPYFTENGIKCVYSPFLASRYYKILYKKGYFFKKCLGLAVGIFRRFMDAVRSARADIVFIHLEALPLGLAFFERVFAFNKPVIYDLDDAIYIRDVSQANRLFYFFKRPSKIRKIIGLSSHVIVCNDYLKKYAQAYNKNITMIPTSVDTDRFTVRPYSADKNERIMIGWIGSHTTSRYLSELKGVFDELAKKYSFTLKIIGAQRKDYFPGIDTEYKEWALESEVAEFQSLDIGVYPLPDNEWVKGKTGFKTIQYMSVGVPCVVSRVGRNIEIVKDSENGFLAGAKDEWVEKISRLIEDAQLRMRIGLAGRKTVEEFYSVRANAQKYMDIFNKIYKDTYGR